MKTIKINGWRDIPENFTGIVEYPCGSLYWLKNRMLHREDGPACDCSNGYKEWWLEHQRYNQIHIKDYVVLDSYTGKYGLIWYKLLGKNKVFEYPDIPGMLQPQPKHGEKQ